MKKVIVFGTFDILHPGHKSFLKQARKLGDYLIVAVARDIHVEAAKGKKPRNSEKLRAKKLRKLGLANKVILASRTHNFPATLRNYGIEVLALGYDQKPKIQELRKKLRKHRMQKIEIKRLRALRPEVYKSSKLSA